MSTPCSVLTLPSVCFLPGWQGYWMSVSILEGLSKVKVLTVESECPQRTRGAFLRGHVFYLVYLKYFVPQAENLVISLQKGGSITHCNSCLLWNYPCFTKQDHFKQSNEMNSTLHLNDVTEMPHGPKHTSVRVQWESVRAWWESGESLVILLVHTLPFGDSIFPINCPSVSSAMRPFHLKYDYLNSLS